MNDIEFTINDIKDLMNAFRANGLGSMKLQQGEFSLKLESREAGHTAVFTQPAAEAPVLLEAEPQPRGNAVKSPIVGTFYAASAPDREPYVKAGDKVKKGDVLFIIESMKLMNEVTSEFDGTVAEILVQNGTPVEYGQPILTIE